MSGRSERQGLEVVEAATGYSGTPLAKKLGVKAGHTGAVLNEPEGFRGWLVPLSDGVRMRKSIGRTAEMVVIFTRVSCGAGSQRPLRPSSPMAAIWVGWPKKSSNMATDITEDILRDHTSARTRRHEGLRDQ